MLHDFEPLGAIFTRASERFAELLDDFPAAQQRVLNAERRELLWLAGGSNAGSMRPAIRGGSLVVVEWIAIRRPWGARERLPRVRYAIKAAEQLLNRQGSKIEQSVSLGVRQLRVTQCIHRILEGAALILGRIDISFLQGIQRRE